MIAVLGCLPGTPAETTRYELRGHLLPPTRASMSLHGATAPFEESALADDGGRFRFRDLLAGTYTLGAFVPGRGEIRRTIEIGPSQADVKKRIELTVELRESEFESQESSRRTALVSARDLAIPERARREYEEAEKRLGRRDVEGARAHLQRAVELAPQYSDAWNHLGTIAYQGRDYARAENCFTKALEADPNAYQPLVNLGGVSINLGKFDKALQYNLYAALTRPNDALANSQLGMSYFLLSQLDHAEKYLTTAKKLDPAHFSHPQLVLAQIAMRRQNPAAAAGELEEFLQQHPDAPEAGKVKEDLARLRGQSDPAQAFAATGMAHSFSQTPDSPLFRGDSYSVVREDGRLYFQSRDTGGRAGQSPIDATIGSGRHAQVLLSRKAQGGWTGLPLVWLADGGGRYAAGSGFPFSADCLGCHTYATGGQVAALGCTSCHQSSGAAKPGQAVCLQCHSETSGPASAHGAGTGEEKFELNSAGYRLLQSRCYQASAGKLTCLTCHPAHGFAKTAAEYRAVCRGCHAGVHNGAPLECPRCHMPARSVQDVAGVSVRDHRIQRPL